MVMSNPQLQQIIVGFSWITSDIISLGAVFHGTSNATDLVTPKFPIVCTISLVLYDLFAS